MPLAGRLCFDRPGYCLVNEYYGGEGAALSEFFFGSSGKWIGPRHGGREKSSFFAAPDLTFFVFQKDAAGQVKAKKCQSRGSVVF